jgi:hypothetical protein
MSLLEKNGKFQKAWASMASKLAIVGRLSPDTMEREVT